MIIDQNNVFIQYENICQDCKEDNNDGNVIQITPSGLQDHGFPICSECGEELWLLNNVEVLP